MGEPGRQWKCYRECILYILVTIASKGMLGLQIETRDWSQEMSQPVISLTNVIEASLVEKNLLENECCHGLAQLRPES